MRVKGKALKVLKIFRVYTSKFDSYHTAKYNSPRRVKKYTKIAIKFSKSSSLTGQLFMIE
jgi:hypothetical protein